jgi:organic radical activating enzyme
MEHFYTIQGEGHYAGCAAYFIRLAGCDVGCVWCDVKESWPATGFPLHTPEDMVSWVANAGAKLLVITGGEPAMYNLLAITKAMHEQGIRVHIETSGAYPLQGDFDWITVSPKKFKSPLVDVVALAHELKVVVFNKSDFQWAETWIEEAPQAIALLQPEWDKQESVMPLIIDYVKAHPRWRISLQTHKIINVP